MKLTPKEARAKWVEALRSGDYKQACGCLCALVDGNPDAYCCLGVACEVMAQEEGVTFDVHDTSPNGVRKFDDASGNLPERVQSWLGLRGAMGGYNSNDDALWRLNDFEGYSFEQIADVIESEPEGLCCA